jgi:L-lactate utilization protein LutC
MKKETIIQTLKDNYNRDLRKQVVKTIQADEKQSQTPDYKIINQIFSYVLKELEWKMADNTKEWDNTPLEIMEEAFPKLESTKWYKVQILTAKKMIEMEMRD